MSIFVGPSPPDNPASGKFWWDGKTFRGYDEKTGEWKPVNPGMVVKPHSEDTLIADGTEQTVAEITSMATLEGHIDLSNMQAGDTIVIREYIRMKSGGSYRLYDETTYSGVQSKPALHVAKLPGRHGVRVTLQQTAGVNRLYDYNFFMEEV